MDIEWPAFGFGGGLESLSSDDAVSVVTDARVPAESLRSGDGVSMSWSPLAPLLSHAHHHVLVFSLPHTEPKPCFSVQNHSLSWNNIRYDWTNNVQTSVQWRT